MENDTITKQMVEGEATYIQEKRQEHGTESKVLQEESGVGYYKKHHQIKGETWKYTFKTKKIQT